MKNKILSLGLSLLMVLTMMIPTVSTKAEELNLTPIDGFFPSIFLGDKEEKIENEK